MTRFLPGLLPTVAAVLAALAIVYGQIHYGGLLRPALVLPGYLLVGCAGLLGLGALRRKTPSTPWVLPVLLTFLFAGWLLWRIYGGPNDFITGNAGRLVLACLTLYLVFAAPATGARERMIFLGIIFCAGLVQAALGGYQFLHHSREMPLPWASEALRQWYAPRLGSRAHGFFINGNHLAWLLNIAGLGALACACWARWKVWARVLALYVAAVCFAGCLPTLSRGGFVGLSAGLSVFLLASGVALIRSAGGVRLPGLLTVLAGVAVAAGAAWLVFAESWVVQARLALLADDAYRREILLISRRLFESAPILGAGAGAFQDAARMYRLGDSGADDVYAHNDWFQVAAEYGFPALALLGLLVAAHAFFGFRGLGRAVGRKSAARQGASSNTAALQIAGLSILAACAAHSVFDFNMQIPANALLAAACLGFLANPGVGDPEARKPRRLFYAMTCLAAAAAGATLLVQVSSQRMALRAHLDAENALYAGFPDAAWHHADAFLETHPAQRDLLILRAQAATALSDRAPSPEKGQALAEEAIRDFLLASRVRPLDAHQLAGLAIAQGRAARFQSAERTAAQVIGRYPLFYGGYQILGQSLEARGKIPEALRAYTLAASLSGADFSRKRARTLQTLSKPVNP